MSYCKLSNKYNIEKNFYIFFSIFLERLTFLVLYIILARIVGHTEFGFVLSVFALLNILNGILDLGIPFYLQRETASKLLTYNQLINSFYIKFFTLFIYTATPLIYFNNKIYDYPLILLIISINFIYGFGSILQGVLNGSANYKDNFIALLLSRAILFTSYGIAFFTKAEIKVYLLLIILILLIQIIHQYLKVKKVIHKVKETGINFLLIRNILKSSLPIGVGLIFVITYDRIDVLLIEKIIDLKAVAIYSVAYSLYRNSSIFSNIILVRAYTDLSESFGVKGLIQFAYVKSILFELLILCAILFMLFQLIPEILIKAIYGSSFYMSANLLKILAFGIPAMLLNNMTGVVLNSIRREKIPMITTAIAVPVNVLLNISLIPIYGVLGAVYTTIITEILVFVLQAIIILKINFRAKFIS